MKPGLSVFLGMAISLWAAAGQAEMASEQVQRVEAFKAGVLALDPHTPASELPFQALVEKYVPASGPLQEFLDFMTASGFKCPAITSLAEDTRRKVPIYHCSFVPDLGPSGEPNLSSVTEKSSFGVIADSDDQRRVVRAVEGYMSHYFLGP